MGRGWIRGVFAVALVATVCGCAAPAPAAPMSMPLARAEEAIGGQAVPTMLPQGLVMVRTADVSVTVDAYDEVRAQLGEWLAQHGGFVADEDAWRTDGRATGGSMRIRVPADSLDAFLAWVDAEMLVERMAVRAADVTAESVDIEARLRAHRAAEERLIGLIGDRAASLADVLAAETELTRIRSEIESLQGRQRVLADQVSLATVSFGVTVRRPIGISAVEPLTTEVGRAFSGSIGAMGQLARGLTIAGAALAPWAVLLGLLGLGAGFGLTGVTGVTLRWLRR